MSTKPVKFDSETIKVESSEAHSNVLEDSVTSNDKEKKLPSEISMVKLKPKKTKSKLLKVFGWSFASFIVTASIYEAWQFVDSMFEINKVLGGAVSLIVLVTIITGVGALIKGRAKGKRLIKRNKVRKLLAQFNANETYGKATDYLDDVSEEFSSEVDISQSLALYRQATHKSHNDSELIRIYNDQVLSGLDELAMDAIRKHATESALMVALSPLAIADMALVAWRSSRMIQEVSRIYGCPQTAFGRLGLTKQVATNLMLAGASEFVAEAGVELLGKGLAATVSTKAAQGIGVGILVSRLGIQTMQLCRPIEFDKNNKPKLSQIRKLLTSKILSIVTSKKEEKNLKQGEEND